MKKNKSRKLVHGFGINDASYQVTTYEGGKQVWMCPYYKFWRRMMDRCHSTLKLKVDTSYQGCSICEDWKLFSNFRKWVERQPVSNWRDCELDKDLLGSGKIYSPETCCFISSSLNKFLTCGNASRGKYMLGVSYGKGCTNRPYLAQCRGASKYSSKVYLGAFETEYQAHRAWQSKKHELSCLLATEQTDPRVARALITRYAPDKDWTNG